MNAANAARKMSRGMRHMVPFLFACLVVLFPGVAQAGYISNEDFISPDTANAFTIVIVSPTTINLNDLYTATSPLGSSTQAFPPSGHHFGPPFPSNFQVAGNGTNRVTVTFTGATFSAGESTHVGFAETGSGARIADSYWSNNGAPATGMDGRMPGIQFSGTSSSWLIERVTLYDSLAGNNIIGHEWVEDQATSAVLKGNPSSGLYYSTAAMIK